MAWQSICMTMRTLWRLCRHPGQRVSWWHCAVRLLGTSASTPAACSEVLSSITNPFPSYLFWESHCSPGGRDSAYPHFTDEITEAESGARTPLSSLISQVVEPRSALSLVRFFPGGMPRNRLAPEGKGLMLSHRLSQGTLLAPQGLWRGLFPWP